MDASLSTFKALSDRNRLRVFAALLDKEELCACQIVELLQVTGATASRHMAVLLSSGLVKSRKEGRWVHYRINRQNDSILPLIQWLEDELNKDTMVLKDRKLLKNIIACDPEELCRQQREAACCP